MKTKLSKLKLNFIKNTMPEGFTHWTETKDCITFHGEDKPLVFIKKPLWLKLIEKVKFNGSYKDYPLLSSVICGVVGLVIGVVGGWMV